MRSYLRVGPISPSLVSLPLVEDSRGVSSSWRTRRGGFSVDVGLVASPAVQLSCPAINNIYGLAACINGDALNASKRSGLVYSSRVTYIVVRVPNNTENHARMALCLRAI